MSIIKSEDSRKWISLLVAIVSAIVGYSVFKFAGQLANWFDLEAKFSSFNLVAQGLGFMAGVGVFAYLMVNKKTSSYLDEVYSELLKVVWPDKDKTTKATVGIAIALVIVAGIFTVVDIVFKKLLHLIY